MRVVLVGGGGHASDVLGAIEALNDALSAAPGHGHTVVGIVADEPINESRFARRGVTQLGDFDALRDIDATHFIAAAGYPRARKLLAERTLRYGLVPLTVIHPRAWVPDDVFVGDGTVVLAGACVSPGAFIGSHAYLSHGALVGHDSRISDYVSVLPGASISGDTDLGEGCTIGANATVIEKQSVGAWSIIGAGAVVTNCIPPNVVAKGIPARYGSHS